MITRKKPTYTFPKKKSGLPSGKTTVAADATKVQKPVVRVAKAK